MGVTPKESTKGQGYMAWGYLLLYRATQTGRVSGEGGALFEIGWIKRKFRGSNTIVGATPSTTPLVEVIIARMTLSSFGLH